MSSTPTKQVDAVYKAVNLVLGNQGRTISPKEPVYLSDYDLESVIKVVTQAALSGHILFTAAAKAKYLTSEKKAQSYCRGMVKNWLLKDARLNGNSKYAPKQPGIRQLSKDPVIQNLKKLRKEAERTRDEFLVGKVDKAINVRYKELLAAKIHPKDA